MKAVRDLCGSGFPLPRSVEEAEGEQSNVRYLHVDSFYVFLGYIDLTLFCNVRPCVTENTPCRNRIFL
jgi:hypothetical protein